MDTGGQIVLNDPPIIQPSLRFDPLNKPYSISRLSEIGLRMMSLGVAFCEQAMILRVFRGF